MSSPSSEVTRRALVMGALKWLGSLSIAAVLLWLASTRLELWPKTIFVPRPELLGLAIALHVPYGVLRAGRLRYLLDPLVQQASGGQARRLPRPLLYGSGLVSFFVIMLLPFRVGELSRPVLLARGRCSGVGMTESLTGAASERVVDGLMICGMLFGGLAFARGFSAEADHDLESVRQFGRIMVAGFALGLVVLVWAAHRPSLTARALRLALLGAFADRVTSIAERLAAAVRTLLTPGRGIPFMLWSAAYWAVTVVQLWLVLRACGIELGAAEACTTVAIIGLSIQLPGPPAQAGPFQVGAGVALALFLEEAVVAGPGSSFAAIMYLLQVVGGAVMAAAGVLLLRLGGGTLRPPAAPRKPDVGEPVGPTDARG